MLEGVCAAARHLARVVEHVDERVGQGLDVVGWDEPARRARAGSRLTIEGKPPLRVARTGSPTAMASSGVCGYESFDRRHHQDIAGGQAVGQVVVAPPAGEEDAVGSPTSAATVDRVLALPLAGVATPDQQRRRGGRNRARARANAADEQRAPAWLP